MSNQIYLIRLCSRYREDADQVTIFDGTPQEAIIAAQKWANDTSDMIAIAQHKRLVAPEGRKPTEEN